MPEPADRYRLNYAGTLDGSTDLKRTNPARIVCQITGAVIPRETARYNDAAVILKRFGITGKRALAPLLPVPGMPGMLTSGDAGPQVRMAVGKTGRRRACGGHGRSRGLQADDPGTAAAGCL